MTRSAMSPKHWRPLLPESSHAVELPLHKVVEERIKPLAQADTSKQLAWCADMDRLAHGSTFLSGTS